MKTTQYDVRPAIMAVALGYALGEEPDLREKLAELSDIPEERLDFAVSEIGQALPGIKVLAELVGIISDGDPTVTSEGLNDSIGTTIWTDDDKRDLTVRLYAEGEEGDPMVTVATKFKAVPDDRPLPGEPGAR